jgi:hypothetical protein
MLGTLERQRTMRNGIMVITRDFDSRNSGSTPGFSTKMIRMKQTL